MNERNYTAAHQYASSLRYADRQAYATAVIYAVHDEKPFPQYEGYKLTRTCTPRSQWIEADKIRNKVVAKIFNYA